MTGKFPRGLRAAPLLLLLAACSQGTTGSTSHTTTPSPAPSAPASATTAPSAAPPSSAVTPGGTGKTIAVTEVNATNMGGAFNPPMLAVHVGDTVEWTNSSGNIHNVTFADSTMHSPIMYGGDKWSQVFTKAGTYKYTCTFHPGMEGTIVVS